MEINLVCRLINRLKINTGSEDSSPHISFQVAFLCDLFEGLTITGNPDGTISPAKGFDNDHSVTVVPTKVHDSDYCRTGFRILVTGDYSGCDSGNSFYFPATGTRISGNHDESKLYFNMGLNEYLVHWYIPSFPVIVALFFIILHQIQLDFYLFDWNGKGWYSLLLGSHFLGSYSLVYLHSSGMELSQVDLTSCLLDQTLNTGLVGRDFLKLVVLRILRQIKLDLYLFFLDWNGIIVLVFKEYTKFFIIHWDIKMVGVASVFKLVVFFAIRIAEISLEKHGDLFGMTFSCNHFDDYCRLKNIGLIRFHGASSWLPFWFGLLQPEDFSIRLFISSKSITLNTWDVMLDVSLCSCWIYLDVRPLSWFITGYGAWAVSSYIWYECGLLPIDGHKGIGRMFKEFIDEDLPSYFRSYLLPHYCCLTGCFLSSLATDSTVDASLLVVPVSLVSSLELTTVTCCFSKFQFIYHSPSVERDFPLSQITACGAWELWYLLNGFHPSKHLKVFKNSYFKTLFGGLGDTLRLIVTCSILIDLSYGSRMDLYRILVELPFSSVVDVVSLVSVVSSLCSDVIMVDQQLLVRSYFLTLLYCNCLSGLLVLVRFCPPVWLSPAVEADR